METYLRTEAGSTERIAASVADTDLVDGLGRGLASTEGPLFLSANIVGI